MLVVNTNINSLKAQRELDRTRFSLSLAMQRISSGVRLNSSKDDAVGVSISERMTSQIKGLSMAIKNANDGIGFLQTAEGSLQEVTNLMQRMRELAIQAIDGALSPADKNSMQGNIRELNAEIARIASHTELNGKKLLSGDVINEEFQIGIRAEQTLSVSISGISPQNMGSYSTTTNNVGEPGLPGRAPGVPQLGQGEALGNFVESQMITLRGFASDVVASQISIDFQESARSIAAKINGEQDRSGISASAKTTVTLENMYDSGPAGTQTIVFRLYGKNVKVFGDISNAETVTANIEGNTLKGLNPLISAINDLAIKTGITAEFVSDPSSPNGGRIKLVQEEGEDISIEGFRNTGSNEDLLNPTFSGPTVRGMEGAEEVFLVEGTDDSVTVGGVITFNSFKAFSVTSDADTGNSLFKNGFDFVDSSSSNGSVQGADFFALADIDLKKEGGASDALQVVTNALDFISSMRSELGTVQNRFESIIANLGSVLENAEAARSRIYDADFAEETARLTKAQILQEAGIAMLAQANTIPQAVLALLRA